MAALFMTYPCAIRFITSDNFRALLHLRTTLPRAQTAEISHVPYAAQQYPPLSQPDLSKNQLCPVSGTGSSSFRSRRTWQTPAAGLLEHDCAQSGACAGEGSFEPLSRDPPPLLGSRDGVPRWADGDPQRAEGGGGGS